MLEPKYPSDREFIVESYNEAIKRQFKMQIDQRDREVMERVLGKPLTDDDWRLVKLVLSNSTVIKAVRGEGSLDD